MKVNITCTGADLLPLDQILEFQGDLKNLPDENYEKLKKQMLELGFSSPLHVWRSAGKFYLLDGHQRLRALVDMKEEGIELPPKFPVVWVEAKNKKEAKRKLLALASQYGEMSAQGLYDFMADADLSFDETKGSFRFPEIEFEDFKEAFFDDPGQRDPNGASEITDEEMFEGLTTVCPSCGFHFDANAQAKKLGDFAGDSPLEGDVQDEDITHEKQK